MNAKSNFPQKRDFSVRDVTEAIARSIDAGFAPWREDWSKVRPVQTIEGHVYRGINFFLLTASRHLNGFSSPIFATYNKVAALGGTIRKGQHGTKAVYWAKDRRTIRRYTVFNLDQTDGLDLAEIESRLAPRLIALPDAGSFRPSPVYPLPAELADAFVRARLGESCDRWDALGACHVTAEQIRKFSPACLVELAQAAQDAADRVLGITKEGGAL